MYKDKKVIHIVCTGKNGEIGYDNKLLFNIPPDMKFFREQTLGHTVLIGRATVESLPKPLDRRIVVKVTSLGGRVPLHRWLDWSVDQCCETLNTDKIFIAGGAKLFQSTFDIADELWITEVANDANNCDTWYKIPKEDFTMFEHTNWMDYTNPLGETLTYRFTKWGRNKIFHS
jgi:dihydrofolate reductase